MTKETALLAKAVEVQTQNSSRLVDVQENQTKILSAMSGHLGEIAAKQEELCRGQQRMSGKVITGLLGLIMFLTALLAIGLSNPTFIPDFIAGIFR